MRGAGEAEPPSAEVAELEAIRGEHRRTAMKRNEESGATQNCRVIPFASRSSDSSVTSALGCSTPMLSNAPLAVALVASQRSSAAIGGDELPSAEIAELKEIRGEHRRTIMKSN